MDEAQTPTTPEADRQRALAALRAIIETGETVTFRAQLEPRREFYWVTVQCGPADISTLIANATGFPLDLGRFRHSIEEILARLRGLDVSIDNYCIVEDEPEGE